METCCKVFDFEEYRSYFLTTNLFSASSFLVCSIHRYMVTSSLRNSGQWLSLSGSGSNSHICACVCIFMCMSGYTWNGHIYHIHTLYAFLHFNAMPNIAEALEISSGSRMELIGRMGSWLQDQLHVHVNQSPTSSHRHAWDTCVSARLYVCMCASCVCSRWVKHLSRTSRDKEANYHEAGHCRDAHSYLLFKLAHWIWV